MENEEDKFRKKFSFFKKQRFEKKKNFMKKFDHPMGWSYFHERKYSILRSENANKLNMIILN